MKPRCTKPAISILLGLALCGCAESKPPEESNITPPESTPALTREERIEQRLQLQGQKNLERVAQDETLAVTGEAPDELLDKVMADLEQRTGATRSEFTVLRAEAVQWNDGSMGCGEPGQMYTQAIVPGFWIVIDHQGEAYDYRASERGYFKLCPDPHSVLDQIRDKEKGPPSGAPVQ